MSYEFFFSSRRRHTICLSDWSSDVCSSDLYRAASRWVRAGNRAIRGGAGPTPIEMPLDIDLPACFAVVRSEERRVGKECSCGLVVERLVRTRSVSEK